MRILASNPDTIGDVLLRQPLYRVMQQNGHEVCLVVRPLLEPLIPSIAPGARVVVCREPLYEPSLTADSEQLAGTVEEARSLNPDLLLVAPFQWTPLEERLSIELSDIPCIAMTGKKYTDPNFGPVGPQRLRVSRSVPVSEDLPELSKNQLLASAMLGRSVQLPSPSLEPEPHHLTTADTELARLGLNPGGYWVACVGDSTFSRVRNWEPQRWAAVLSQWAAMNGRRFLLIGSEVESQSLRDVVDLMPEFADHAFTWTGKTDGDLAALVGLIARSAGYVGRDTGPMHLAAALSKPVLALFGGGTWPRFLPAAGASVSMTISVPCSGCGWVCHLQRSHCIKDIPVGEVLKAAEDLEAGRVVSRETRVFAPDSSLLARIGRGGAEVARQRLVEISVLKREQAVDPTSMTAALEKAMKQAARVQLLEEDVEQLRNESARRESVLRQRLAATENTAAAREADLRKRLTEAERRLEEQTVSTERLASIQSAHRQRESELHGQLVAALAELSRRDSQESDLALRLERLEADRQTLGTLTSQQEAEVVVLRQRIHDLLASRWRRYGQKLGLCMKLPWESENGKP
jgi:ADP-heptose:LPS heptosyltransferase